MWMLLEKIRISKLKLHFSERGCCFFHRNAADVSPLGIAGRESFRTSQLLGDAPGSKDSARNQSRMDSSAASRAPT
jgi:hypothetical protein